MGTYKNKTFPLRIDNNLQAKVEALSQLEKRNITQQYELIVEKYINEYEKQHGTIKTSQNEQ